MSLPVSAIQPVRAESNAREVDFVRDFFDGMAAAQRSSQIYLNDMRRGQEMALAQDKFGHLQEMDYMKFDQRERAFQWQRETDMLKRSREEFEFNAKMGRAKELSRRLDWLSSGAFRTTEFSAFGQPQGDGSLNTIDGTDSNGLPSWGGADTSGLQDLQSAPGKFNTKGLSQGQAGTIVSNGAKFSFVTGGSKNGKAPYGVYEISRGKRRPDAAMSREGYGFSFHMLNVDGTDGIKDSRVGKDRTLLRIHPDGKACGTQGCFGIQGGREAQQQFFERTQDLLKQNGGKGYMGFTPNGESQIFATVEEAQEFSRRGGFGQAVPQGERGPSNALFPESGPVDDIQFDFTNREEQRPDPNPYGFTQGYLNLKKAQESFSSDPNADDFAGIQEFLEREKSDPQNIAALKRETIQKQKDDLRGLNRNHLKPNYRSLYDRLDQGIPIPDKAFGAMSNFAEDIFLEIAQESPINQFEGNRAMNESEAYALRQARATIEALETKASEGESLTSSEQKALEEARAMAAGLVRLERYGMPGVAINPEAGTITGGAQTPAMPDGTYVTVPSSQATPGQPPVPATPAQPSPSAPAPTQAAAPAAPDMRSLIDEALEIPQ